MEVVVLLANIFIIYIVSQGIFPRDNYGKRGNSKARYILDFQERKLPERIPRELEISITKDVIVSIIGSRRAGKTYYFVTTQAS